MAGLNGSGGSRGGDGSPATRRSPPDPIERPSAAKGTDTPADIEHYFATLVSRRVFGEEAPDELVREVAVERQADEAERLQQASEHRDPGQRGGPSPKDVNRQVRRARRRKKRVAKVVAAMIERARQEGADPDWKPEAFPALDWRIKSEAWAALRDVSGRKARTLAAALPPAQGEQLVLEAQRIAAETGLEDGYATVRWRELVAGAWVSWRLSRPVRAKQKTRDNGHTRTGDYELGNVPPDPEDWAPPVKRQNPWAGGRVVDGYARQAFALLMRDVRTGAPMSISKLFYRNGSGEQGVFGYLATPARDGRSRAIDGVLGLYSRWQPPAHKSKYVGPPKLGPDGQPLLDKHGRVQRYALSEHWYHRRMCGRRAAAQADRGNGAATSLLRELCPWLFAADRSPEEVLAELEQLEGATETATESPYPGCFETAGAPGADAGELPQRPP